MRLITLVEPVIAVSKTGKSRKRKMGVFECPVCLQHVTKDYSNGLRSDTCGKGCKDNGCTSHSMVGTPIYVCWANIRQRCDNPNNNAYKYYGALGIKYPVLWSTFEGFFSDMGMTYREGLTIDRKDKLLDYSKSNCQWLPMEENRIKDRIKSVTQHTLDGLFVASYCSTAEAGRQTGLREQSIARAARGERRHAYGFVWEYV